VAEDSLPDFLEVTHLSLNDGTIEGLESDSHPWLMAVQFHPEDLVGFHAPSQRLFGALVEAAKGKLSPLV